MNSYGALNNTLASEESMNLSKKRPRTLKNNFEDDIQQEIRDTETPLMNREGR